MKSKPCLICEADIPEFASRLGIEACRACASFFKRTKVSGRAYACRQGDDNCTIVQGDKYMCRKCRYEKCIRFGMELQPRNRKPKAIVEAVVHPDLPSTSSSPVERDGNSLIDRMEQHYKSSCERRLVFENEYAKRHNLQKFSHPDKTFYIATFTAFCDLYRITIKSLESLIASVFDDFESFSVVDQVTLYKNFILKFTMSEGIYFTPKYFKDSSTMFVSSMISCSDVSKLKSWNNNDEMLKNDAFRRTARGFANDYMDLFGPMNKMDDLTEREFYAMAILNYCDIDSLSLPDAIVLSMGRIRSRVFKELQGYYKNELKLDDYSQRLGNLLTLAHGAGEAGTLLNEEMRMYATIFDVNAEDRLFREFFT